MLHEAIHTLLAGIAPYIYPDAVPQTLNMPYIVTRQLGKMKEYNKDGDAYSNKIGFRVACYAPVKNQAETMAATCLGVLNFYSGTVDTFPIHRIRFDDEESGYNDELKAFEILQDYFIWLKN